MVQFYFNNVYPAVPVDIKPLFADLMKHYMLMYQQRSDLIEEYVITNKAPSLIQIQGTTLSEAIFSIADRDVRVFTIAALNKYPIDESIKPEVWDENGDAWDYTLSGISAEELYFSYRMGWLLLSLPVSSDYKSDTLTITHRHDISKTCEVHSFYGDNSKRILQLIDQLEQYTKAPLATLVEDILEGCPIQMSDEFVKQYSSLPVSAQKSINEVFRIMHEQGNVYPVIKADKKHIKRCVDFDGMYELRVLSEMGPRVYMMILSEVLYLGDIGTKAESVGVEQTADMKRAYGIIFKLIAKK